MNKYLVILAGSPRGGERTYSSLYKRVCEYLSADLAICTSIDKVDEEISLFKKADYKWILDIQDDFFKYYEKNFHGNWKEYFEKMARGLVYMNLAQYTLFLKILF